MDNQPIRQQLDRVLQELKGLTAEVRLQIHLGTMDLKKAWDDLEPKLAEADLIAERKTEEAFASLTSRLDELRHIHAQLPKR